MVQLFVGNPSQSYRASPAIWDHTVLPATRHRRTRPAVTRGDIVSHLCANSSSSRRSKTTIIYNKRQNFVSKLKCG